MVRISILYPNTQGSRFDFGYYIDKHMPWSNRLLNAHPGFRGVLVENGLGGAAPGVEPEYVAMCYFQFNAVLIAR